LRLPPGFTLSTTEAGMVIEVGKPVKPPMIGIKLQPNRLRQLDKTTIKKRI
jgi:hypothetical protein